MVCDREEKHYADFEEKTAMNIQEYWTEIEAVRADADMYAAKQRKPTAR